LPVPLASFLPCGAVEVLAFGMIFSTLDVV
jgi:hypothetical protein